MKSTQQPPTKRPRPEPATEIKMDDITDHTPMSSSWSSPSSSSSGDERTKRRKHREIAKRKSMKNIKTQKDKKQKKKKNKKKKKKKKEPKAKETAPEYSREQLEEAKEVFLCSLYRSSSITSTKMSRTSLENVTLCKFANQRNHRNSVEFGNLCARIYIEHGL